MHPSAALRGGGGGGGGAFTAPTFLGVTLLAPMGTGTQYFFDDRDIGAADANRWIIAMVSEAGLANLTGATYNAGVSLGSPIIQNTRANNGWCAAYCVNIAAGTTADFTFTYPSNQGYSMALALYRMIRPGGSHGLIAGSKTDSTSFADGIGTVTIPSGGRGLWAGLTGNEYGGGAAGFVGTGMVDDYSPAGLHAFGSSANVGSTTGTLFSGGGGSERVAAVCVASPGS